MARKRKRKPETETEPKPKPKRKRKTAWARARRRAKAAMSARARRDEANRLAAEALRAATLRAAVKGTRADREYEQGALGPGVAERLQSALGSSYMPEELYIQIKGQLRRYVLRTLPAYVLAEDVERP